MPCSCLLLDICANREAENMKGCNSQLMNLQQENLQTLWLGSLRYRGSFGRLNKLTALGQAALVKQY